MVDMTAPYAGDYVRSDELPPNTRIPAVIRFAGIEQVGQGQTPKAVLTLAAQDGRPWPRKVILNKGNAGILTKAFGKDGAAWIGQTITIWNDPSVTFKGEAVGGLKVAVDHQSHQAPASPPAAIPLPGPVAPAPGNGAAPSGSGASPPGNGTGTTPGYDPTGATANMAGHTVPLPGGMPSAPPNAGGDLDDEAIPL
jgi:hypothetical protein